LLRNHVLLLLLGFVPVSIALELLAPERHIAIFCTSVLAILPLAAYMGRATEALADHLGGGIGGLLNATFGNAAELIIGALALRAGLTDLVKASLTGSIIGNVLLVFGAAALVGGLRRPVQRFNRTAAGLGTTMLLLSTIGLVIPAVFHRLSRGVPNAPELELDTEIALVLFLTYCASLVFTLKTHRALYGPPLANHAASSTVEESALSGARQRRVDRSPGVGRAVLTLFAATIGVAVMSELLVGTASDAARSLGMSELFVGVVVIALVGKRVSEILCVGHSMRRLYAPQTEIGEAAGRGVGADPCCNPGSDRP
jgi:Ca2+:H+ antiporter